MGIMKVKEFIKKYRMSSNCEVFTHEVNTKDAIKLNKYELQNMEPKSLMDMKVNSFEIIDNILTIYVA